MLTLSARRELLSRTSNGILENALTVKKRNGDIETFDIERIKRALNACMVQDLNYKKEKAEVIAEEVAKQVQNLLILEPQPIKVEEIQNRIESQLMAEGYFDVAKQYILYRDEKRRIRDASEVSEEVVKAFKTNDKYFANPIQKFQALDKFARYDHNLGRRETWQESVSRVMGFFKEHCEEKSYDITSAWWERLESGLLNLQSSPSMRCVQMAGPALKRCHVGVYNCSFQFLQVLKT